MALKQRQVVTVLSILYLAILTAVASYAMHLTRLYSLPVPSVLAAFTLALPAVAGLSLESALALDRKGKSSVVSQIATGQRPQLLPVTVVLLIVYDTVIATLSGTYIAPVSGLKCGLDETWRALFRHKDEERVRRIQDSLQCCGLHSVYDMAWPFPAKGIEKNACQVSFRRNESCFGAWIGEERRVAGLLLLVTVLVFMWKILFLASSSIRTTWLKRILNAQHTHDDAERGAGHRRALEYQQNEDRYLDNPPAEEEDRQYIEDSTQQIVDEGGNAANDAAMHGHIVNSRV